FWVAGNRRSGACAYSRVHCTRALRNSTMFRWDFESKQIPGFPQIHQPKHAARRNAALFIKTEPSGPSTQEQEDTRRKSENSGQAIGDDSLLPMLRNMPRTSLLSRAEQSDWLSSDRSAQFEVTHDSFRNWCCVLPTKAVSAIPPIDLFTEH